MVNLLPYIVDSLKSHNTRHEIHKFASGAVMVDIWINDRFYVIQIDDKLIGLSFITENTSPFDMDPDITFSNTVEFKNEFEKIFDENRSPKKRVLVIDGNNFDTPEQFYCEVDNVFTRNLDWNTGHNLDAFNDLLRGGFGVYEFQEQITLIWKNSAKSKHDFQKEGKHESLYNILIEIIRSHGHIEFSEE